MMWWNWYRPVQSAQPFRVSVMVCEFWVFSWDFSVWPPDYSLLCFLKTFILALLRFLILSFMTGWFWCHFHDYLSTMSVVSTLSYSYLLIFQSDLMCCANLPSIFLWCPFLFVQCLPVELLLFYFVSSMCWFDQFHQCLIIIMCLLLLITSCVSV